MSVLSFDFRGQLVFASMLGAILTSSCFAEAASQASNQTLTDETRLQRFDDWYYRCAEVKAVDGKALSQCEVAQIAQVKQGEENVNVLTLAIAKAASEAGKKPSGNKLLLTALVPLNVVLPIGLGLAADGKDVVTIPYRNCNQAGCWAQQKLDQKMLSALQKGSAGEARLRLMNGQNINLKFSLKGLTKALAELQKPTKA
ncbi:invasion-associated locus B family protein [Ochrobactrum sp. MYb29]|nr:invasion-associated locus B family protein [Ochrobactrum sp. MYb29]